MLQQFIIGGRLPGYNELHSGHWANRWNVKSSAMDAVCWAAKIANVQPVCSPVNIFIHCFEPNARRDRDNVTAGANKIILDALQRVGILRGDGQKYVRSITNMVDVDRDNPRIEVVLAEIEQ